MMSRMPTSHCMLGEKAAASEASPNSARLKRKLKRRPKRSPRNPAANEPMIMPTKVIEMNVAFIAMSE